MQKMLLYVNYKVQVYEPYNTYLVIHLITDPICKMDVDEHKAKFRSIHNGKDYCFCSAGCKATFDKNPEKYAK
jgi:YHS domain-containing protein